MTAHTYSAEIITIGSELLKGSTLNTNAQFVGRELTDLGFAVTRQTACDDNIPVIKERLAEALRYSDLIVLSGGLGPTPDDVTREAIAEFFNSPLILSKSQLAQVKRYYFKRGRRVPEIVKREALFPENATPLINRYGIALGFSMLHGTSLVVVLPGVPSELEKMFKQVVRSWIKKHFRRLVRRPSLVAKIVGLSEPEIMQRLGKAFFRHPLSFGIYPQPGEVSVRVQADKNAVIRHCLRVIRQNMGNSVYAYKDISLAEAVGERLVLKRKKLAVAESCTGGLLASEITKVAGASRYFLGSITAYQDKIKRKLFDSVGEKRFGTWLDEKGAASKEIATALAHSVRRRMNADFGIGITGIAGPGGGSPKKPVGLVFIALSDTRRTKCWRFEFLSDRNQIQTKAVKKALELLWRAART